jgi:uncharacterized protein YjhX (UPF0386 family)
MSEQPVISPLYMDRDSPIGNSVDDSGRRGLHVIPQGGHTGSTPYSSGRITVVSCTSSAWTAAPDLALIDRKSLLVQNTSESFTLLWNYTNDPGVTTGYELTPGGIKEASLSPDVQVYLRVKNSGGTISQVIEELS